ncbi:hypothetical protein [Candidatus Cardinium sp. cByotN1]|uniref:hypothetical protein n=1 Tax=Candidatus Cardinium sp. cByotN1 TaxID=2699439 RepID=UPI001FB374F1|nr:hypothetical protein [Candidatus Cardinium sp. cByotN1]
MNNSIIITALFLLSAYSLTGFQCTRASATMGSNDPKSGVEKKTPKYNIQEDDITPNPIVAYTIEKDQIYLDRVFQPTSTSTLHPVLWAKETTNHDKHQRLFDLFACIIPQQYRKGIKYFSIIDSKINNVDDMCLYCAIGPQSQESLAYFRLYMAFDLEDYIDGTYLPNASYNTLGYDFLIYTMIHELGHYVTMNNEQDDLVDGYLIPHKNSICAQMQLRPFYKQINNCSKKQLAEYYKEIFFKKGEFVTDYATESFAEDAAETFAHFVLTDERPKPGLNGAKDKMLLFYQDPKMVQIRASIRENLKNLGIHPKPTKKLSICARLLKYIIN